MSSETKTFCSRCGSTNTNTLKAKQSDESIQNMVVKSEPTFMWNAKTGETGIGNEDTTYDFELYMCSDCNRFFALVKSITMRKGDQKFTIDGSKPPDGTVS